MGFSLNNLEIRQRIDVARSRHISPYSFSGQLAIVSWTWPNAHRPKRSRSIHWWIQAQGKGLASVLVHRFRFLRCTLATVCGTQLRYLSFKLSDALLHQLDLVDQVERHADTVAGALQFQFVQVGLLDGQLLQ